MTLFQAQRIDIHSPLVSQWDEFVAESSTGTVYHSSAWLTALAEGMSQNIQIHAATASGKIQAGVVLRVSRKYGFTLGRKPWATAYNGLVVRDDADSAAIPFLLGALGKHYHHLRLVHPPGVAKPPLAKSWRQTANSTAILNISDADKLWDSFDRHARQRIRKATSFGVTIAPTDALEEFYNLYRMTYLRQQLPMPLSCNEVTTTLRRACGAGAVRCFGAFTEQREPAAMLVVGQDNKRAYFMLAGSHPSLRKTDAVSLLWWNVMLEYAKTHREIDLVGMGIGSIAHFKNSWSPQSVPFYETTFDSSWLSQAVLEIAQRVKDRKIGVLRR